VWIRETAVSDLHGRPANCESYRITLLIASESFESIRRIRRAVRPGEKHGVVMASSTGRG